LISMSYRLVFLESALREWKKLDSDIRLQFKKKLLTRLNSPRVETDRLRFLKNCYKLKLRSAGYRLVYQVREKDLVITVIGVGKREGNAIYNKVKKRI